MSGFSNNIHSSDQINHSIALIGGVTAHSYSTVGLLFSSVQTEVTSQLLESSSALSAFNDLRQHAEPTGSTVWNTAATELSSNHSVGVIQTRTLEDEPISLLAPNSESVMVDSELLSRYETFESVLDGVSSLSADIGEASTSTVTDSSESANDIFLLTNIFAEAFEQAKASQTEFENTLDDSRQGSVQDLIAMVTQPIGSSVLPQLGPFLVNFQDELQTSFA